MVAINYSLLKTWVLHKKMRKNYFPTRTERWNQFEIFDKHAIINNRIANPENWMNLSYINI